MLRKEKYESRIKVYFCRKDRKVHSLLFAHPFKTNIGYMVSVLRPNRSRFFVNTLYSITPIRYFEYGVFQKLIAPMRWTSSAGEAPLSSTPSSSDTSMKQLCRSKPTIIVGLCIA